MFNRNFIAAYRYNNLKKTAHIFFLSLLAGKFKTFEQMLLTETVISKKKIIWRMRILSAHIFLSFLAGKLKTSNRICPKNNSRNKFTKHLLAIDLRK